MLLHCNQLVYELTMRRYIRKFRSLHSIEICKISTSSLFNAYRVLGNTCVIDLVNRESRCCAAPFLYSGGLVLSKFH